MIMRIFQVVTRPGKEQAFARFACGRPNTESNPKMRTRAVFPLGCRGRKCERYLLIAQCLPTDLQQS